MSKVNFLPFDCICRFWAFCNLKIAATKARTVATTVATEHSKMHEWRSFDAIDVVSLNASMPVPSYSIQLNCIVWKRKVSIDRLQRMCTRSNEKSLTKIYTLTTHLHWTIFLLEFSLLSSRLIFAYIWKSRY